MGALWWWNVRRGGDGRGWLAHNESRCIADCTDGLSILSDGRKSSCLASIARGALKEFACVPNPTVISLNVEPADLREVAEARSGIRGTVSRMTDVERSSHPPGTRVASVSRNDTESVTSAVPSIASPSRNDKSPVALLAGGLAPGAGAQIVGTELRADRGLLEGPGVCMLCCSCRKLDDASKFSTARVPVSGAIVSA